ncbi:MAG: hypothetical protein AAGB22_07510, partial [Bacteroidota bacterium]
MTSSCFVPIVSVLLITGCASQDVHELKEEKMAFASKVSARKQRGANAGKSGSFSRKVRKPRKGQEGKSKAYLRASEKHRKGEKDAFGKSANAKERGQLSSSFARKVKAKSHRPKRKFKKPKRWWQIWRARGDKLPKEKSAFASSARQRPPKQRVPEK